MEKLPKMIGVFAGAICLVIVLMLLMYMQIQVYLDPVNFPEGRVGYFIADTIIIFWNIVVAMVCALVCGFVTFSLLKLVMKHEENYKNKR